MVYWKCEGRSCSGHAIQYGSNPPIQDIEHIEVFYDYVTSTWVDNDALFDLSLWNCFDFKSSRTNNSLEGWHHRLNTDLNYIIHPHFCMYSRAIQNDYAYNSAISSRHTVTGTIPPRKKFCESKCTITRFRKSL
ncbi:unnamed protein product [Didymodactylos carnosus]|uniref:Uncharacterized protein n=1 Tax=Didymodactylos carnosus TaxID=1234261 RepID=A0A813V7K5_9BILA|nr:unnamed protein product [Didymodactylos carnosus]CAF1240407.1 unnamed protein product [Didymodactylos carnosus]CAF3628496.1 unnamed protein product [Didymodactylos carnosus]CAF4047916.1 unnamed protein product [Didymodactylos carnosus]